MVSGQPSSYKELALHVVLRTKRESPNTQQQMRAGRHRFSLTVELVDYSLRSDTNQSYGISGMMSVMKRAGRVHW